jgi:hypothetical protein
LGAAIVAADRPFDQVARLQALERAGRGGAVERDIGGQRGLVGDPAHRERRQQAVLQRGDFEVRAFCWNSAAWIWCSRRIRNPGRWLSGQAGTPVPFVLIPVCLFGIG